MGKKEDMLKGKKILIVDDERMSWTRWKTCSPRARL